MFATTLFILNSFGVGSNSVRECESEVIEDNTEQFVKANTADGSE